MPVYTTTADLAMLPGIRDYVLAHAREAGLTTPMEPRLDLVLEEILVNVAKYAYNGDSGNVDVDCAVTDNTFCVTVRDRGVPFNPLEGDTPEFSTDVDERRIGGVGILLVTHMADRCSYERVDDTNELTFCFAL
ncbi:ATP-binding protein [Pseudodesulfovibrio sp. zrk46]|uniref:ATP-binding protein n=1 Tax=Pseudodesulfovibrio sp. zrk46 TaxID=2725288 RepID=UPI001448E995|nr:ATP-binding protein [Pseudodesulfovibrio sp. zrk46]QJB56700.1 ATP-binding protein [Pseudodesulfovibrio sp. zrk46]